MGKLTPAYKKAIIDELLDGVLSGNSCYYAFASDPNPDPVERIPPIINNDYNINFLNDWQMIFGKKLQYNNFSPVVKRVIWTANTIYNRYDNTADNLYENGNFYVYSQRVYQGKDFGGGYYVYKCIDNNYDPVTKKGSPSTVDPGSITDPTIKTTFQTSDGYKWRYITTVSKKNMDRFSTGDLNLSEGLSPINPDQNIITTSSKFSGVEVCSIVNPGSGYEFYHNGIIELVKDEKTLQLSSNASGVDNYYNNNAIYIYNDGEAVGQIIPIERYFIQNGGKFVSLVSPANTQNIITKSTKYIISPQVVFESDGVKPRGYAVINAASNNINKIVITDSGSDVSWANVKLITTPAGNVTEASIHAILPPPGGHGSNPAVELGVVGFAVNFQFCNTESRQIPGDGVYYNKIGLFKNPYGMNQNTSTKSIRYRANTFNQLLVCNVNQTTVTGQTVIGQTSNSRATIVLSNATNFSAVGDQTFQSGENVMYANGLVISQINVWKRSDVYAKDIYPIYVQNINKVARSNTQTEEFKLIIQL